MFLMHQKHGCASFVCTKIWDFMRSFESQRFLKNGIVDGHLNANDVNITDVKSINKLNFVVLFFSPYINTKSLSPS